MLPGFPPSVYISSNDSSHHDTSSLGLQVPVLMVPLTID